MSGSKTWKTELYHFSRDYLSGTRGISHRSLVISHLRKVVVDVGRRRHMPRFFGRPDKVFDKETQTYIEPAQELHVNTSKARYSELSGLDQKKFRVPGHVQITYSGVTDNSKGLSIEIDLTKVEALQLARALISAAEELEESEQG